MDILKDIDKFVDENKNKIIKFFADCIAIKSYTCNEKEMADFLLNFFQRNNIHAFRTKRGSVLSIITPKRQELENDFGHYLDSPFEAIRHHISFLKENNINILCYNAHMDIVGEGDSKLWTSDPFSLDIREGKIYGRGTCDMKCSLVAMTQAMIFANNSDLKVKNAILGCFVTEEEAAEGLAFEEIIVELGIIPDFVILGEPTGNKISLGQRGKVKFTIEATGKRAHSSVPEKGINAIYPLSEDLLVIDKFNQEEFKNFADDVVKRNSVVVTKVITEPDDSSSVISFAKADVIARLAKGETFSSLICKLSAYPTWKDLKYNVETYNKPSYTGIVKDWKTEHKAWLTDKDNFFVKKLSYSIENVIDQKVDYTIWPFSTDGVLSASRCNIPTVGFGAGFESVCHIVDEYVDEKKFFDSLKVYLILIFC